MLHVLDEFTLCMLHRLSKGNNSIIIRNFSKSNSCNYYSIDIKLRVSKIFME